MSDGKPWSERLFSGLCGLQGSYYLVTGAWPLVSIRAFKLVSGERGKTDHLETGLEADHWLIMTVSVLIVAIAVTLLLAAYRQTRTLELGVLAIAAAVGLTAIDVVYTARGVIQPIYLLDAALEIPLIFAWCVALISLRGRWHENSPG
jgi:hypothetical protein